MAWTTPITFVAGNPLTAAQMNVIQANMNAVKRPPAARYDNQGYLLALSSASFIEFDPTNLALTLTLGATARLLIALRFAANIASGNAFVGVDMRIDGSSIGDAAGVGGVYVATPTYEYHYSNVHITQDTIAAGSHTVRFYLRTTSAVTIYTISAYVQEF